MNVPADDFEFPSELEVKGLEARKKLQDQRDQTYQLYAIEQALEGIVVAQAFLRTHRLPPGQPVLAIRLPPPARPWRPLGGIEHSGVTLTSDRWGEAAQMIAPDQWSTMTQSGLSGEALLRQRPPAALGWRTIHPQDNTFRRAWQVYRIRSYFSQWRFTVTLFSGVPVMWFALNTMDRTAQARPGEAVTLGLSNASLVLVLGLATAGLTYGGLRLLIRYLGKQLHQTAASLFTVRPRA